MNNPVSYRLTWIYKDGRMHWTDANTLEMAETKSKSFVANDDVVFVTITRCELVKVLKEYSEDDVKVENTSKITSKILDISKPNRPEVKEFFQRQLDALK